MKLHSRYAAWLCGVLLMGTAVLYWQQREAVRLERAARARLRKMGCSCRSSAISMGWPTVIGQWVDGVLSDISLHTIEVTIVEGADPESVSRDLATFRRLRHLDMLDGWCDQYVNPVREMRQLQTLFVVGGHVADEELQWMQRIPDLRQLFLVDCELDLRAAHSLQLAAQLEYVSIAGIAMRDSDVVDMLSAHPNLMVLGLSRTCVDGRFLEHCCWMSQLESLNVSDSNFNENGVKWLRKFPVLRELNLDGTCVTDEAVRMVDECHSISHLSVRRTAITPNAIRWLKQRHPRMQITSE